VIERLYKNPPAVLPDYHDDMKAVVEGLLGKADSRLLGNRLRSYRRRIFRGRFIDKAGQEQRAVRWAVYPAAAFRDRPGKTHKTHDTHSAAPAADAAASESGECGESFFADVERERVHAGTADGVRGPEDGDDEHGDSWEG
jgi:hypothetical protein